ncbi:MAG: MerR family transcriptional regulator [Clostridiales bacterium]|nr:MerR family transcriptional regulator [Clostridiales bacterium]
MNEKIYTSKVISELLSVSRKTLRHYKEIDLIVPSHFDSNGYWYYNQLAFDKLILIIKLKELGLSLDEIKENIDNNFEDLSTDIEKSYIETHCTMKALRRRKQVIEKIISTNNPNHKSVVNHIDEHDELKWLRQELSKDQMTLVENMIIRKGSCELYSATLEDILNIDRLIGSTDQLEIKKYVSRIKSRYIIHKLDDYIVYKLVENMFLVVEEDNFSESLLNSNHKSEILNLFLLNKH